MNLETQKDAVTKAATTATSKAKEISTAAVSTAADTTSTAGDMVKDYGSLATDAAKTWIETGFGFAEMGLSTVKDFQLGDKNVGERAQATVDTVQEKIDVDQIQDQVAKMRHQMESVMSTWKDSFRPSEADTAVKTPTKKAPVKKASVTKTTVKKAPAKKAPVKKASVTKTTVKKAPAKKAAAKKTTVKKTTVSKTASK
jgi:hypothetical protein